MATNNAPVIPDAVMLDKVLGLIQQGLVDNLNWLDVAFGRAQRIVRKGASGQRLVLPNVYCGGWEGHGENDYLEVSPDSHIGNFSFFVCDEPQVLDPGPWASTIRVPFSIVFWFDLRRVYGSLTNRNTEYLKAQILDLLNRRAGWGLTEGRMQFNKIYEQAENIYRGYTLNEIDNQFLMHPFGGFRFEGELTFDALCFNS